MKIIQMGFTGTQSEDVVSAQLMARNLCLTLARLWLIMVR